MATIVGDSYGQVTGLRQAQDNADTARSQEAARLAAQLRQQAIQNQQQERQFQQNSQLLIHNLAREQQDFDFRKLLATKKLDADAADLDFRKTHEQFLQRKALEDLDFRKSELNANKEFAQQQYTTQKQDAENSDLFALAVDEAKEGLFADGFEIEKAYPTLPKEKRNALARISSSVYKQKENDALSAEQLAKTLNYRQQLDQKIKEFNSADKWYSWRKSPEDVKAHENRVKEKAQLDPIANRYESDKKLNTMVIFDGESGQYVSIVKRPQSYREIAPPDVESDPVTPPGLPFPLPIRDQGAAVSNPSTDPRLALLKQFIAQGMSEEEAIVMADNAIQGQQLQGMINLQRPRP